VFSIRLPRIYETRAEANDDKEKSDKALKVVDQMGGRCLPMLLRRLKSRDPALKTRLVQWLVLNHLLSQSMAPRSADIVRGQALTAITKTGLLCQADFSRTGVIGAGRRSQN